MRILIDPGHGGRSTGTLQGFLPEKDINLAVALSLAERLKGWDVVLTRDRDVYLSLSDRVEITGKVKPDVFLSIHHNAYEEEVEYRSEVYTGWELVSPSYDLAYLIYGEMEKRIPERRFLPPLPSTYTVVKSGPDVRLLTELFFAREVNDRLIDLEVDVLHSALETFRTLPTVEEPDPIWTYGRWSFLPEHRTTPYRGPSWRGEEREDVAVVLKDGRAFWYGLYLSRRLNARYLHTGRTLQEDDLHLTLKLRNHRGPVLILRYGPPEIRYYHTNSEGREMAEVLADALNYPLREGSTYLLIHFHGPRVLISSPWGPDVAEGVVRALRTKVWRAFPEQPSGSPRDGGGTS